MLPLYIVEPEYWRLADTSTRQWLFTADCLHSLRQALGELGQPLVVRVGEAVDVLDQLCRTHAIEEMVSHEETGNGWSYERDLRVRAWARRKAIRWVELSQSAVVRGLKSRDGWAARRNRSMAVTPLQAPLALPPVAIEPGRIPAALDLGLADDGCTDRQIGGREQGLRELASFLNERGRVYRAAMSSPLSGERCCSRLSPYLASGCVVGAGGGSCPGGKA